MRSILFALVAAFCALSASAAEQEQTPKDMVLLTVSGTIGVSNRGVLDPKKDNPLAMQKIAFPKAFAFDRPMLLGLEHGSVKAQPAEFAAPATFKGPLLREVLGRIEAAKMKITFMAVDGYTGYLTPEDVDGSDWILALEATGLDPVIHSVASQLCLDAMAWLPGSSLPSGDDPMGPGKTRRWV